VFFVISGYVVSASLGCNVHRSFPGFLLHFYARRMMRILPTLLLCLLVTALATALLIPVARVRRSGIMVWIGKLSYSIYLWHWPAYASTIQATVGSRLTDQEATQLSELLGKLLG
jgi:peptidoglycan/LPS O-acetylase OafA/YrhL